jgi:glutaminyl-peptide cyclotransferase
MKNKLTSYGWTVEDQKTSLKGQPVNNVIAKRGTPNSAGPWTIIGAHFDSRMKADRDPDPAKRNEPVPGADDGASGVAVMMELARILPKDMKGQVWLAFIDSEDQGDIAGWDWTLGSAALADSLTSKPTAVIILDMIGDANLNIMMERNSNPELNSQIWETAVSLGYSRVFINQPGYSMLDDHTPFLEKGMPAIDIIDFDYPYWHTTADTADKVSSESLKIIGDTILKWLLQTQSG